MKRQVFVQSDKIAQIISLFQYYVPDIFDGCFTVDEYISRSKSCAYLFEKDLPANSKLYAIEPSNNLKGKDVYACVANLSISVSLPWLNGCSSGYDYHLTVLWFQNDYAFPIAFDVLDKLRLLNFTEEAVRTDLPF